MVFGILVLAGIGTLLAAQVRLTEGTVVIPTYVAGPPEKNPFFHTGRV